MLLTFTNALFLFFRSSLRSLAFNMLFFNISSCLLISVIFDVKSDFPFLETSPKYNFSSDRDIQKFWQLIPGTPQQISHYTECRQNSVAGKSSVRKITLDAETTKVLTDFYFCVQFQEHFVYLEWMVTVVYWMTA